MRLGGQRLAENDRDPKTGHVGWTKTRNHLRIEDKGPAKPWTCGIDQESQRDLDRYAETFRDLLGPGETSRD